MDIKFELQYDCKAGYIWSTLGKLRKGKATWLHCEKKLKAFLELNFQKCTKAFSLVWIVQMQTM